MYEIGQQHPVNFREEIAAPFFERVLAGESCAVVGAPSMGKTRLLDFIMRSESQQHYLKEQAQSTLLLRVDCNRMALKNEWGLYELLLTSIVEGCDQNAEARNWQKTFNDLRQPVILQKDALLALRTLELAAHSLVRDLGLRVCFILDEFDDLYKNLPAQTFANLRAVRDANKNRLCYALFMRDTPDFLREPVGEMESFYELISRFVIGLKPYVPKDALSIITQYEERRQHRLAPDVKQELYRLSGGHPGMLIALFDVAMKQVRLIVNHSNLAMLVAQVDISEECRKLFYNLPDEEQKGLYNITQQNTVPQAVLRRLEIKGLISTHNGVIEIFNPLFDLYVRNAGSS